MLETESTTLAARLQDLERKVIEQGDEIVCLRATLADVLRRLNLVESLRQSNQPQQLGTQGALTAPNTPIRNGYRTNGTTGIIKPEARLTRFIKKEDKRTVYNNNSSLPQVSLQNFK